MSAARHETNRLPINHDVDIRIRNFGNLTIEALGNFTVLIAHVGILWFWMTTVSSTLDMPFPLLWACILVLYLGTIAKNVLFFRIVIAITRVRISENEDEKRSWNRDLGPHTTNLEDWILANFCVVVGFSTMGFVAWYWIEVITLTCQTFFYWTCTMSGLCSLYWLLKPTIRLYREVKGVKHEEAWVALVGGNVLRFYDRFKGLKAKDVLGVLLDAGCIPFECLKFMLDIAGFNIGRGPLFDRLSDDLKAARRDCKTPADVANFFAVFAGSYDEDSDNKKYAQDLNDEGEACFSPSAFEYQPNPVIFHHLRDEHFQSLNCGPSLADNALNCHLIDTAGAAGRFCPDMAVDFDVKDTTENNQNSPGAPRHTVPATMSVNLSSFACLQCTYVAEKRYELNKHVNRTHNHRFKCVYHGCRKTFCLLANLERHEATHRKERI